MSSRKRLTRVLFCAIGLLTVVTVVCSSSLQAESKYQTGTITKVKQHEPPDDKACTNKCYDVSIRVGGKIYVVLFTPADGSNIVEYRTGLDLPVLIEEQNIKFNDLQGRPMTVPILQTKDAPPKKTS